MAKEGGQGYIYIYTLKGDGRGRGLILFTNSLWGFWLEVSIFKNKKALMGLDSSVFFFFLDVVYEMLRCRSRKGQWTNEKKGRTPSL